MIKTVVMRAAAVSMTVYFTNYVGFWGTPGDSERLVKSIGVPVDAMVKWLAPTDWQEKNIYNDGVKKSFAFISQLPEYISRANRRLAYSFCDLSHPEVWMCLAMQDLNPFAKRGLDSEASIEEADEKPGPAAGVDVDDVKAVKEFNDLSYLNMWEYWKQQLQASVQKTK
ncbi:uncharacterized protein LOC108157968 [Drosophila miranda]|uniref:uncharacterized protein LOC108157968 n=1 Tax=Drosophila miranda TaxID=7229 RepID=UPI0007E7A995|nr:uncharacterized protein LOC108157968 [Drosophila miranda]XP_033252637.1 uncharacterized protein LOC108157968 [Drosophila miranda]